MVSESTPDDGDGPEADQPLTALMIGLVLALFGCGMAVAAVGAWLRDVGIERDGAIATAVVTDRTRILASDGTSDHRLEYRFETAPADRAERGGRLIHTGRALVSRPLWERTAIGDPLPVRYDPSDPARSFPAGEGVTQPWMMVFAAVMGLGFGAAGSAILVALWRRPGAG